MRNVTGRVLLILTMTIAFVAMAFAQAPATAKGSTNESTSGIVYSNEGEIKEDVDAVPCANKDRLNGVRTLFIGKGADENSVMTRDFGHVKNIEIDKKGDSAETIIIGAHYDEAGGGCGALDNWTGIVIISHLYKTIKDLKTRKSYKFVAFGKEEQGLVGSRAMVKAIPKDEMDGLCAMVNLDSFGMTYPQAMRNVSSKSLMDLAKETAGTMKMPFKIAAIQGASSDSAVFRNNKIPAITLHGLTGRWRSILHTSKDKPQNVNTKSVYFGYRFALNYLAALDRKPCDAFRKKKKKKA